MRKLILTAFSTLLLASSQATIITVTSLADSGPGSLRDAITISAAPGDTIQFGVTGTINLVAEITWSIPLTIDGPGASQLVIDGGNSTRLLRVNGGACHISGITLQNANAGSPGGACIWAPAGSDTLFVKNCVMQNSNATQQGGAILLNNGRFLVADNCTFENLNCDNMGGAIVAARGVQISNCAFLDNTTNSGGGCVWFLDYYSTFVNCTFSGNGASAGGALYSSMADVHITNCTFSGNTASFNGSSFVSDDFIGIMQVGFYNNIFNDAGTSKVYDLDQTPAYVTDGNICNDNSLSALLSGANDQNNINPNLGPLGFHGGATQSYAIDCTSPASSSAVVGFAPTTDQRGFPRDASPDKGSHEFQWLTLSTVVNTNVSCFGGNDGSTTVSAATGTPPYTYNWSTGGSSATETGMFAGVATVTVTDANLCSEVISVTITEPSALTITLASGNAPLCNGGCDGDAIVDVTGGVSPYSYLWDDPGAQTTQTATGICAGLYSCTITDANGCTITQFVSIPNPSAVSGTLTATNPTSQAACDGSVTASTTGGNPPYSYTWNDPASQTTPTATGLCGGVFCVQVTDANGCSIQLCDTLFAPPPVCDLVAGVAGTVNASCYGASDGGVDISVNTTNGPVSYQWSNGANTQDISGVAAGQYTITVTDTLNCDTTITVTVSEPTEITATGNVTDATCGNSDGAITVTVTGGTGPYTYQWNTGDITATTTGLAPGVYTITATDATGCSNFGSISVNNTSGPTITISNVNPILCNGDVNGAIDISVSGGTTPYTFNWSNGATTEDNIGLAGGPYQVTVSDASGCQATQTIVIPIPSALTVNAGSNPANCGSGDGVAFVTVNGGTAPYSFNWSSGGTTNTETGLSLGAYTCTVTDVNGCTETVTAVVMEIGGPTVQVDTVILPTCGASNGAIDVSVYGGLPPYSYNWSTGPTTQDISGLAAGQYTLMVTGSNGCTGMTTINLTEAPTPFDLICLVTVDTNTLTNQVVWEKMATGISQYNIYRESSTAGVYQQIGSVPFDSLSVFTDSVADPSFRSYRYKLSATDTCGNESELSPEHKTIHLVTSLGLGNDINLIWDNYEGFAFGTFYIYRYHTSTGWVALDSVPSTLFSYTDTAPPTGTIEYMIEALPPATCVATRAQNYNSSRSNRGNSTLVGILPNGTALNTLSVFPNPNKGSAWIRLSTLEQTIYQLQLFDLQGRMLMNKPLIALAGIHTYALDMKHLSAGMYTVRLEAGDHSLLRKIIIE